MGSLKRLLTAAGIACWTFLGGMASPYADPDFDPPGLSAEASGPQEGASSAAAQALVPGDDARAQSLSSARLDGAARHWDRISRELRVYDPAASSGEDALRVALRLRADLAGLRSLPLVLQHSASEERAQMDRLQVPDVLRSRFEAELPRIALAERRFMPVAQRLESALDSGDVPAVRDALAALARLSAEGDVQKRVRFDPRTIAAQAVQPELRTPARSRAELEAFLAGDAPRLAQARSALPRSVAALPQGASAGAAKSGAAAAVPELSDSDEAIVTPRIQALADSLGRNPVRIHNWVRNTIDFVPTHGAIQGAELTLISRRGNAADTNSLLVALLRASGIPARFVYGTVDVPIGQAVNWLKADDAQSAVGAVQAGGIPSTLLRLNGQTVALRLQHVWVEAHVDFTPSRGARHRVPDAWVPMDASFKQYTRTAPIDVLLESGWSAQAAAEALVGQARFGNDGSVTKLDTYAYQQELDRAIGRISQNSDYAQLREPQQWMGRYSILASELPVLAGTLPFAVSAASARFAALPASLKFSISVEMFAAQRDIAYENPSLSVRLPTVLLHGRSLYVNYQPASATDALGLQSYADSNAASLPLGAFRVIPQIKLGDSVLAEGPVVGMGVQQFWQAGIVDLQGRIDGLYEPYQFPSGSPISFTPDLGGVSESLLDDQFSALPDSSQQPIDRALHLAGIQYWFLNDHRAALYAQGWGGHFLRMPSVGAFAAPMQVRYFFGIPRSGSFAGFATDIKADRLALHHDDPEKKLKLSFQIGANGSLSESTTWDLLLNNRAGNSLSASSIIAWANDNGVPIHTIDASNVDAILPKLQTTADVKDEIRHAALSGMVVVVPEREYARGRIQAAGYVMLDPTTGAGVYRVDGGLNGALNVGCIAKAVLLKALCESRFARLMAKRLADLALRFALRIGLAAVMAAVAPPLAIILPVVSAVLLAVTIIQVTYEVLTWVREVMNGTISLTPEELAEAGIRAVNEYACSYLPPCFDGPLGQLGNAAGGFGGGGPDLGGAGPNGPTVGNPVSVANGVKSEREVDYQGSGPFPLSFVRSYLSYLPNGSPIGHKWTSNYHLRLRFPEGTTAMTAPSAALVQREDGGWQQFVLRGGVYVVNADIPDRLERITDGLGRTTQWRMRDAGDTVQTYDADGRLLSIRNRTGLSHTLVYANDGQLERVEDDFGRSLRFEYDAQTRQVVALIDPQQRRTRYSYADGALVGVDYPDTTRRQYHYETPGWPTLLTGITDGRGQRYASWTYDDQSRVIESTHADGAERVRLQYEGDSTTVTDARGASRTYRFTRVFDTQRMTESTQPCASCGGAGSAASIQYDGAGYPVSMLDHNGNRTTFRVNGRGMAEAWTQAAGTADARSVSIEWHPTWNLPVRIVETAATGGTRSTVMEYDVRGNPSRRTVTADGSSRVWAYAYNTAGQKLREDGPRTDVNDVIEYSYDALGNLATMTDGNGLVTRYTEYDASGKLLASVDPNGTTTRYAYDGRDRLSSTTVLPPGASDGDTTRYGYDGAGHLTRLELPDGSALRYSFDAAGRMTGVQDNRGNRIAYTLNASGDREREDSFDPDGRLAQTMSRSYDVLGRLREQRGAEVGDITRFDYDANGNQTALHAPLRAQPSRSNYDALNRLTASIDPSGGTVRYRYDAQDNLREVTDPRGLRTTYGYNGFDELTALASPDTGAAQYLYDDAGNLIRRTDARGIVANFGYDASNRPTSAVYPDETVSYTYDEASGGAGAKGQLTTLRDGSGSTRFVYDAQGRAIAKVQQLGADDNAAARKTVGMAYAGGLMSGMSLPSGATVAYSYGSDGRMLEIRVNGQVIVSEIDHFLFGEAAGWTTPAGRYQRSFDSDGRISGYGRATQTTALRYDLAGRVIGKGAWNYGYDDLDRLTQANGTRSLSWQYDATGNRTQETDGASVLPFAVDPASNRLAAVGGVARQYDPVGNTTLDAGLSFLYSGRNRMSEVRQGALTLARYAHNGMGERVCVAATGGSCPSATAPGANFRQYVYDDGGRLLGEYDSSGALLAEHLWMGNTPVAVLKPAATAASHGGLVVGDVAIYFVQPDHLDTPRAILNAAGNTVWSWDSAPFGDTAADENPGGLGAFAYALRFPGQQFDAVTGLHYNYFRDYQAESGRYAQSDPIGLSGGLNTYLYTSDPFTWIDPFGLARIGRPTKRDVFAENCEFFGKPTCECCGCSLTQPKKSKRGETPPITDWQFDHIVADSLGGSNTAESVQLLCRKCNRTDSNKPDKPDYRRRNRGPNWRWRR